MCWYFSCIRTCLALFWTLSHPTMHIQTRNFWTSCQNIIRCFMDQTSQYFYAFEHNSCIFCCFSCIGTPLALFRALSHEWVSGEVREVREPLKRGSRQIPIWSKHDTVLIWTREAMWHAFLDLSCICWCFLCIWTLLVHCSGHFITRVSTSLTRVSPESLYRDSGKTAMRRKKYNCSKKYF